MKLVWSAYALADRTLIFDHIEADNPRAAIAVDEKIASALHRLKDFPESGRPGRVEGTRELIIAGMPYIAIYAVLPDRIRILRVLHGAQRWPPGSAADRA